ncbi:MAG: hypothetical protein PHZ28_06800 [Candidatus Izemoplasmatales bacterium]|nr:hypothetical protein [Candidatus Izemoplasmatales bacterium]
MSRTNRKDYYEFSDDKKKHWDKKKWYKPNKTAKNITKSQERAKIKNSLRHILEKDEDMIMPKFYKHNEWDWN